MKRRVRDFLPGFGDRTSDRSAGTATRPSTTTHGADLQRQAGRVDGVDDAPADVALGVRAQASGRTRAHGPARRAERVVARARRRRRRRVSYEQRARQHVGSARVRNRMVEIAELDRAGALLGHLTAWLPGFAVLILAAAMLANDPFFIVGTLRSALDVPESTGFMDVADPDVVVSLAAGLAVSATLLGAAVATGKALGTILFRRPVVVGHEAAAEAARRMPTRLAWVVVGLAGLVLAVFMVILHAFATARFEQDVTALFTGTTTVNTTLTWFITLLPLVVVIFETIGSAPQLEHARRVARWSVAARARQAVQIRRNQWQVRGEHRAVRRARRAVVRLCDILGDVGLRTLNEVAEAALSTGMTRVDGVARQLRELPPDATSTTPSLDLSGRPTNPHLPGLPVASNAVADVLTEYAALCAAPVPEHAPLAAVWHDVRSDPSRYCAVESEDTGATSRTCRPVDSRPVHVDLRGLPAGGPTDAAGEPAA